jgi:hypothetical protein
MQESCSTSARLESTVMRNNLRSVGKEASMKKDGRLERSSMDSELNYECARIGSISTRSLHACSRQLLSPARHSIRLSGEDYVCGVS